MWSVHHDPEGAAANQVTITNGVLLVGDDQRTSSRRVIVRAMGGGALINDYHLHIIAGSGGSQNPGLRFTNTVNLMSVESTHSFAATSISSGTITYSVTAIDGSTTSLASIVSTTGVVTTATMEGSFKVTATVAADDTYRAATIEHTVAIGLLPPDLTFTATPQRLRIGSDQTAQFSVTREGAGDVTWSIVEDAPAAMIDGNGLVTAGTTAETITIQAVVAATTIHSSQTITTTLIIADFVDFDGDGLIEISSLEMLHNMRHDLAGASYKNASDAAGVTTGCPGGTCRGYELVNDLDFDADGDGSTWDSATLDLDEDDSMAPYFVVVSSMVPSMDGGMVAIMVGGWQPIGDASDPFTAIFEGNGHVIRNLAIRRDQEFTGLFGDVNGGTIRNLGLEEALADYTGTNDTETHIGTLVGRMVNATLIASHASGVANGGTGEDDNVGGLVGQNWNSAIIASYANVTALGGDGDDKVGGLVGENGGGWHHHRQLRHRYSQRQRRGWFCGRPGGPAESRCLHRQLRHRHRRRRRGTKH